MAAGLAKLHASLAEQLPAAGTVSLRLEVDGDGQVTGLTWLANTLVADQGPGTQAWAVTDGILQMIAEHCWALQLPPSTDGGATSITLPFILK